jgi:hypothetical protein
MEAERRAMADRAVEQLHLADDDDGDPRHSRRSRRSSASAPPVRLNAIGEASMLQILEPDTRAAVLHALYALSQVVDGSGIMPDRLIRLFEEAAAELLGAQTAVLYEYTSDQRELHQIAIAHDGPGEGQRVRTCFELGEGELGTVAERAAKGEQNVVAFWSPVPNAHSIAVPMCTRGGRGRLVGVVQAVREGPGAAPFRVYDQVALRALADGAAALVLKAFYHRQACILRYQAELKLALHAADTKAGGLDNAILAMILIMIQMLSAEKVRCAGLRSWR